MAEAMETHVMNGKMEEHAPIVADAHTNIDSASGNGDTVPSTTATENNNINVEETKVGEVGEDETKADMGTEEVKVDAIVATDHTVPPNTCVEVPANNGSDDNGASRCDAVASDGTTSTDACTNTDIIQHAVEDAGMKSPDAPSKVCRTYPDSDAVREALSIPPEDGVKLPSPIVPPTPKPTSELGKRSKRASGDSDCDDVADPSGKKSKATEVVAA